jgi:hypothetical protein
MVNSLASLASAAFILCILPLCGASAMDEPPQQLAAGGPPVLPLETLSLNADVGKSIQQARDAETMAREKAAAARDAQANAQVAAQQARASAERAASDSPGNDVVVQKFDGLGTYQGGVSMDARSGPGVWMGDDGERYAGDWQTNNRNGFGVTDPPNGIRFEGNWKDGKPCGVGVVSWPNGDRYEGDYCDGHYSGYGVFYFSRNSNTNYVRENAGQWANDKQTGYGVRLWAAGTRSEGEWLDGELNGYAAEFDTTGHLQTKMDVPQQGRYDHSQLKDPLMPP